jgi:aspartate/methionine/tyrosine aminotransferase
MRRQRGDDASVRRHVCPETLALRHRRGAVIAYRNTRQNWFKMPGSIPVSAQRPDPDLADPDLQDSEVQDPHHQAPASARSDVPPFIVMDVMAAAARLEAAGRRIIHMEVGQPAARAPAAAIAAAQAALARGQIGYTVALGNASLRQRIARYYAEQHGADVDPGQIAITTGSSAGFMLAFLTLFEPGDRVAIASPGYPPYRNVLAALGCEAVPIEVTAETRFALTPAALRAAHRERPLKGVLVASPANPSGTMMTAQALADLVRAAEDLELAFISDEIYHGLDYAFPAETALNVSARAVVINSFSKYFCMTGWRVGWMVVPAPLVRPIERLQQNFAISVPTLSQVAAEAAFDGRDEMEAVKRGYEVNRRILTEGLPRAGFDRFLPADGAFYLYADVSRFGMESPDFARRMLEEAGVAATPGVDFDPVHGRQYVRFCYAGAAAEVSEAVERIGGWLRRG